MAEWVQNILFDDVRLLLIAAAGSLGILVLFLLMVGLRSKRRQNRARMSAKKSAKESDVVGLMTSQIETQRLSDDMTNAAPEAGMAEINIAPPPLIEKLSAKKLKGEARILKDIRRLEQEGESIDLVKAYTERGSLALRAKDTPVAQEYFLMGLSMAGLLRAPEHQAFARTNLGDISQSDGDLSTACEHWQLARDLYRECGEMDKASDVEDRMDENQCPTDWVLNEF